MLKKDLGYPVRENNVNLRLYVKLNFINTITIKKIYLQQCFKTMTFIWIF